MTLYAASSDGTIAVFAFEQDELEGISPHSVQEQYLSKFGFTLPPLPEGFSHPTRSAASSQPQPQSQTFDTTTIGGEVVNVLVAKRNNKRKRVGLTTTTVPSAGAPSPFSGKRASFLPDPDVRMSGSKPASPLGNVSFFPTPDEQPFDTHSDWKTHDVLMGPADSFSSKQEDDPRPVYRTLGGDRQRELVPVKEIKDGGSGWGSRASSSSGLDLPVPATLTRITADVEGGHVFEGLNPEDGGRLTWIHN